MGIGMWLVAGLGAFALARLLRAGRPQQRWIEIVMAITFAVVAGLTATALDFGGWREPDARAGVFAFVVAFGAIGIARAARGIWGLRTRG